LHPPEGPSSFSSTDQRFFVYIVRCFDGSYYVGHAADVSSRVMTHNAGRGAAWTAARRPVALAHTEPAATEQAAVLRERQLKGWTRAKKEALIAGDVARLKRLGSKAANGGVRGA
jgi:predicted GIY-YIG superfamily endonuclease